MPIDDAKLASYYYLFWITYHISPEYFRASAEDSCTRTPFMHQQHHTRTPYDPVYALHTSNDTSSLPAAIPRKLGDWPVTNCDRNFVGATELP